VPNRGEKNSAIASASFPGRFTFRCNVPLPRLGAYKGAVRADLRGAIIYHIEHFGKPSQIAAASGAERDYFKKIRISRAKKAESPIFKCSVAG